MNKETKVRIHNITAKAALKFGSEVWVLKKREEQRLEAAQIIITIIIIIIKIIIIIIIIIIYCNWVVTQWQ